MLAEKTLDKSTIDTYHAWVQAGIRNDLNSISFGPGKLPFRTAIALLIFGLCSLLTGILLVALRMRHVYLWDWDAQFLGPFFCILFLLCLAGSVYMIILAKRRSNKYRSQLYFRPVGDWGVNCVHKSELAREEEIKHDLKSGTTPHKTVKPRSEAYSQSGRKVRPPPSGRDNQGYDKTPQDSSGKPFPPRHDDHHRGPPRGPPDGRRGPRGPPPPGARRGPPPPDGRRHPDDRPRGPPPEYTDRDNRAPPRRSPPPNRRGSPPPNGRRSPPPNRRGSPPPNGRRSPPRGRRSPPPNGRRSPPLNVRRSPPHDDDRRVVLNRQRDESSEI